MLAGATAVKRCKLALQAPAEAAPSSELAPSEIAQLVGLAEHEVADLLDPMSAAAQPSARLHTQARDALAQLHSWCSAGAAPKGRHRQAADGAPVPRLLHELQIAVRGGSDVAEAGVRELVDALPEFVGAASGCSSAQNRAAAALARVEGVHQAVASALGALRVPDPCV